MIAEARKIGAGTVLMSLCSHDAYAGATREVAGSENLPYVDGKDIFEAACRGSSPVPSIRRRPPTCARSTGTPPWPGINGFM